MPRKARIDAAGALNHIIIRGIERKKIFHDDKDLNNFVVRIGEVLQDTETECYSWALMPNHAHFLLRTGRVPISTVMRRVLTGYAVSYNRRYNRHGKLFQNRYKSILCQEELYLKELVRYIHLNPLRAGLTTGLTGLDRFPWCGHSAILGNFRRAWQNIDYVLGFFGTQRANSLTRYREFVENGIPIGRRPELVGGGLIRSLGGWEAIKALSWKEKRIKSDERILGDEDFVERAISSANEDMEQRTRLKAHGIGFDELVAEIARLLNISPNTILNGNKRPQTVKARSILCYYANRYLGLTTVALARKLRIGQPAVSRSVRRGEKIAEEENLRISKIEMHKNMDVPHA